ncbi:MAG: hypothetical protein ABI592_01955 [Acidobacteriota bacterium]
MRRLIFLCVVLLVPGSFLGAAEVFGTISENGKPVPRGVAVKLDCAGVAASGATDEFGSYSVKTASTGDCRLTVEYKKSTPSLKVALYEKPARYDLVVKDAAGKVTVARK